MIKIIMATYHRPDFLKDTLESLATSFVAGEDCQIYVYDNNSGDAVKDQLEAFKKRCPSNVASIVYGDRNIGKAKALNSFIPEMDDDDVICSFDSDLVIAEPKGSFFEWAEILMRNSFPEGMAKQTPSVFVPDQTGDAHHKIFQKYAHGMHTMEKNWEELEGFEEYAYLESEYGFHIAGGCLFTRGSTYKAVGGYRENRGIFGGNDGYYLLDASRHEKNPVYIMRKLVVWHPSDEDEGYAAWKQQAQDQQRAHQRCLSYKGFYD